MDYDVVIATRNRVDALRMSLPLIAAQTHPPAQVIIVDASDNLDEVPALITSFCGLRGITFKCVSSLTRSSAFQRNAGLEHVRAPITMMPDDDSLWYPDTAEEIMRIYERPQADVIGGVTAKSVVESPLIGTALTYSRNVNSLLKTQLQPFRSALERSFVPQPFIAYADELMSGRDLPPWVDGQISVRVATIGGFRMSFRSDVIRQNRFDELLGYKSGYCQHEDMDASLRVQKSGRFLVSAERARVFHHTFPGKRTGGFNYGFGQLGNYLYICCKNIPKTSKSWQNVKRYIRYKLFLYSLKRDAYGQDVFRGARFVWENRALLINAPSLELASAFRLLCDQADRHTQI